MIVTFRPFSRINIPLVLLITCCLVVSANQAWGGKAKQLEILRAHIRDLQAELARPRTERKVFLSALQKIEQAIGQSARQLAQLNEQLARKESHLQILEKGYTRLQDHRYGQRKLLIKQIRNAYIASRRETLKLL